MKRSSFKAMKILSALAVGIGSILFVDGDTWAQEKHKIAFKALPANSKYTQQLATDVGDVPGHQVRVLELHQVYPTDPPAFEGVKLKEAWTHGYSDYVDINGHGWGYVVYTLENGDKIFGRYDGTSQTTQSSEGKQSAFSGVTTLTGGTGKFRGIRGMLRNTSSFDPKSGFNETQQEGEYWMGE